MLCQDAISRINLIPLDLKDLDEGDLESAELSERLPPTPGESERIAAEMQQRQEQQCKLQELSC